MQISQIIDNLQHEREHSAFEWKYFEKYLKKLFEYILLITTSLNIADILPTKLRPLRQFYYQLN